LLCLTAIAVVVVKTSNEEVYFDAPRGFSTGDLPGTRKHVHADGDNAAYQILLTKYV
jgi:hypothetical protein